MASAHAPIEVVGWVEPLERQVRELPRTGDILRKASAYFARAEFDPIPAVIAFIDDHRAIDGVEPTAVSCRSPVDVLLACRTAM